MSAAGACNGACNGRVTACNGCVAHTPYNPRARYTLHTGVTRRCTRARARKGDRPPMEANPCLT